MNTPKISIIIPVLNMVGSLEKAIQSILNQTYKNIELIIIDGGSTDGTLEIIKKYIDRINFWISERDSGIYDAMNKGIKAAKGDWLYFLGADDIMLNGLHLYTKHFKNQHVIYYGDVYFVTQNEVYGGKFSAERLLKENICQQALFYPKRVFDKFRLNTKYKIWADYELNTRCWGAGWSFKYMPVLVALYSGDGFSSREEDMLFIKDKEIIQKSIKNNFKIKKYLKKAGLVIKALANKVV